MSSGRHRLPTKVHAESLLAIPLVRAAFSHPALRPTPRGIDLRWHYHGVVERPLTGFVPLRQAVFYGRHSRTADWLLAPQRSSRDLNAGDHLASEVLFCVHDHLHAWALGVIRESAPALTVSPKPKAGDLEDLAFVHLVTEAAATVGLDYWYLSELEPHEVCDIGMTRVPLTTPYHERYLAEYRRFRKDLVVQDPAFFAEMAKFYCDGRFVGFTAKSIGRSPRLARWLTHEIRYGQRQREYARQWLSFMTGKPIDFAELGVAVGWDAAWKKAVIHDVAEKLWAYVKTGVDRGSPKRADVPNRCRGLVRPFDPRFVNVATMTVDEVLEGARGMTDPALVRVLVDQFISTFAFDGFDGRRMAALVRAREGRDLLACHSLLQDGPRVAPGVGPGNAEPKELFLLG